MEFRLVYDGMLLGASRSNTRSEHKHEIRRVFHKQLKRLWETAPHLRETGRVQQTMQGVAGAVASSDNIKKLSNKFRLDNYRLVPLATRELDLGCGLDILFLRYDQPGQTLLQSGDIDNRLKTLFDALRIPQDGEYCGKPLPDEDPFFCLLEDDSMISRVSVTTDVLLEPNRDVNDVRLVITARIWPLSVTIANIGFGY